jgi:hypothetical protein
LMQSEKVADAALDLMQSEKLIEPAGEAGN